MSVLIKARSVIRALISAGMSYIVIVIQIAGRRVEVELGFSDGRVIIPYFASIISSFEME